MVTDEAPAKGIQQVNPSLRILPETFDASSFAICVAKDHAELQQSINHAIRILKENGVIDSIVNRHLERGIAVAYTPKTSDVKKVGLEALQKLGLKTSLRFATNATFEPFEYYQNGKIVGIDVDVANAIGDVMGVDVEILDMGLMPSSPLYRLVRRMRVLPASRLLLNGRRISDLQIPMPMCDRLSW